MYLFAAIVNDFMNRWLEPKLELSDKLPSKIGIAMRVKVGRLVLSVRGKN